MKANPAGILIIGLGVVLLNLAYTGRGVAVWNAITGSDGASAGTTGETPTIGPPRMAGEADPVNDRGVWAIRPNTIGGLEWA